jgi:hypothetical protein
MVGYKRNMCICIQKHVKASQDENIMRQKKNRGKNRINTFGIGFIKTLGQFIYIYHLSEYWCM